MSNQISDSLLQAMQTLVESGVNSVAFDKTEVCTVISKVENEENIYWVSNGSIKYQASAEIGKEYGNDTSVYVTIPQGNYDLEKIIIGSYKATKEDSQKLFTNPFNNIVKAHSLSKEKGKDEIAAVGLNQNSKLSAETNPEVFYNSDFGIPNYLALRFNAKTALKDISKTEHFKIMIDLQDEKGNSLIVTDGLTEEEVAYRRAWLTFDSSQITGNPYNLQPSLWHEHLFPFPLIKGSVVIFSDLTLVKKVAYTLISPEGIYTTLEIPSLEFFVAYSKSTLNKNQAVLDSIAKTYPLEEKDKDKLIMRINWHDLSDKTLKNIYFPYVKKENDEDVYQIYWFKYIEGYTKNTQGGNDIEESGVFWKTIADPIPVTSTSAYEYTPNLSINNKSEQYKAAIVGTGYYVETNGITFTNSNYKEPGKMSDLEVDNLILFLEDGDDGVYNDYGPDGKLLNFNNIQKHKVSVKFADNMRWYDEKVSKITWKIPKKASMLYLPYLESKENGYCYGGDLWKSDIDDNYYVYEQDITGLDSKNDGNGQDTKVPEIEFGVRDQFDYARTHNTLYCNLTLSTGEKYQGKLKLSFGIYSTNGTDYSLNIRPIENITSLDDPNKTNASTTSMKLQLYLEKSDGTEISKELWAENVIWSWHTCTTYKVDDTISKPIFSTNSKDIDQEQPQREDQSTITITRHANRGIDNYAIIKAQVPMTTSNGNKIILEAYYPIPSGSSEFRLEGPTRIVYNSNGQSPQYDNHTAYNLLKGNTEFSSSMMYDIITSQPDIVDPKFSMKTEEKDGKTLYQLVAPDILIEKIPKAYIKAYYPTNGGITVAYIQPILILRNQHQSSLLNQWDGKLTVDEDNNQIFAATMIAGSKDNKNRFSGVVLGSVGNDIGSAKTGLYGYQAGNKRYELTEDGTFYVGKGDDNKINFDINGNLSIATKEFNLVATDGTNINMLIRSKLPLVEERTVYRVGDQQGGTERNDWKLWLGNGKVTNDNSKIPIGNFGVASDGTLYAQDAVIHGEITFTNSDTIKNVLGIPEIQNQIDKKIDVFYQDTDPSDKWTDDTVKKQHIGDIWKYTGADSETRRTNSEWVWQEVSGNQYQWIESEISNGVFDVINGKSVIYTNIDAIEPQRVGDLLIPTVDIVTTSKTFYRGKVYKCTEEKDEFDANDWEEINYTDDSSLEGFIQNTYGPALAAIATQDDKIGETWYQSDDPANNWTTNKLKAQHVGDLWYNTNTKKSCLYTSSYEWTELEGVMQDFYDKTDKKATIYISQPSTWQKNDLLIPTTQFTWGSGTGAKIFYKDKVYKSKGNASDAQNDWIEIAYTDNAEFNEFITNTYQPALRTINESIDKKVETWYQSTDPSTSWTTPELKASHVGDLWKYTGALDIDLNTDIEVGEKSKEVTAKPYSEWMWTNALDGTDTKFFWQEMMVPDEVYDKIDGKKRIFTSQPTPPYAVGDLWVQGSNGDIKHCTTARSTGSHVSSDWVKSSKYTDNTKADIAHELATNAENLGNRLVNDLGMGTTVINKKYVISPYIGGGYLRITNGNKEVLIDPYDLTNQNKIFQVKSNGSVVIGFDTNGNATFNGVITAKEGGNIGGWKISSNAMEYFSGSTLKAFLSGTGTQESDYTVGNHTGKDWSIWANGKFGVTKGGTLYATGVQISGTIVATNSTFTGKITSNEGEIAGWTITKLDDNTGILYSYAGAGFGSGLYMKTGGSNPAFYVGYENKYGISNYPIGATGWGNNGSQLDKGPKDKSWFSYGSVKGMISNNGYFAFGDASSGQYIVYGPDPVDNKNRLRVNGKISATSGYFNSCEMTLSTIKNCTIENTCKISGYLQADSVYIGSDKTATLTIGNASGWSAGNTKFTAGILFNVPIYDYSGKQAGYSNLIVGWTSEATPCIALSTSAGAYGLLNGTWKKL